MRVTFILASDRTLSADIDEAVYAELLVALGNPNEVAGWVQCTHADSGWPVLVNLAQVATLERAAS